MSSTTKFIIGGALAIFFIGEFAVIGAPAPLANIGTALINLISGKTDTLDVTALPLGDGKYGSKAKVGYVYSCQTSFKSGQAGATGVAGWIHGTTWNLNEKLAVQGSVTWPDAQFSVTTSSTKRVFTGNGLPVDSDTGIFPIAATDPAYAVDRNPNSIKTYTLSFSLPVTPAAAKSVQCVGMGMIGVTLNGVAIFNALDAGGRDAVANEVQDICGGHPQQEGMYHYHGPSPCMPHQDEKNALVGYALDGYGIYSRYDANGKELTDKNLDACHGITSTVPWDGKQVKMYHYVLTREYPYTIGCYHGTPVKVAATGTKSTGGTSGPGGSGPMMSASPVIGPRVSPVISGIPKPALDVCIGKSDGTPCAMVVPSGLVDGTCHVPPNSTAIACIPR